MDFCGFEASLAKQRVPGHAGLHRETLSSRKKKIEKCIHHVYVFIR